VKGVRAHLGVHGPKAKLRAMGPKFGYASHAGHLTSYGPILGNKFKRPEIATRKPQFAMKRPHLSFRAPVAATRGPATAYRSAVI